MTEMELKRIREELDKLTVLTSGWKSGAEIPAIERELALGKLRELYDAVRFPRIAAEVAGAIAPMQSETVFEESLSIDLDEVLSLGLVAETEPESGAPVMEESADRVPEPVAESALTPESALRPEPIAEQQPAAKSESVPELITVAGPETESACESVATSETPGTEPTTSPTDKTPTVSQPERQPERRQVESQPEPLPASQPQIQPEPVATLFELEDETEQHRRKQRVIMSLYGSSESTPSPRVVSSKPMSRTPNPVPVAPVETEFDEDFEELSVETVRMAPAPAPAPAPATAPTDESFEVEPRREVPDPDSDNDAPLIAGEASGKEEATVLGEVINHHVQTLADTFAPRRDTLSEAAHHAPVKDLRAAIGINDRFLLVRDLFAGDGRACDTALDALNGFDNLDDCMIHIAENYAWNPNSDGAKFLMELLERKYA